MRRRGRERGSVIEEREKQTGHSSLCHCTGCSGKVVRRLLPPATSVTLTAAFIGRSALPLEPESPPFSSRRSQPDNRESRALIADRATSRLANESSIRRNERGRERIELLGQLGSSASSNLEINQASNVLSLPTCNVPRQRIVDNPPSCPLSAALWTAKKKLGKNGTSSLARSREH